MRLPKWIGRLVALSLIAGCAAAPLPGNVCDLTSPIRFNEAATFDYLEEHEPEALSQILSQNRYGALPESEGGCGWTP